MKAVDIRELEARLSEYVRLARGGETILITDRREVVAELRPARRQAVEPESLEAVLEAMAESGELTRASLPKTGWGWSVRGLGLPEGTARNLLDEQRGER